MSWILIIMVNSNPKSVLFWSKCTQFWSKIHPKLMQIISDMSSFCPRWFVQTKQFKWVIFFGSTIIKIKLIGFDRKLKFYSFANPIVNAIGGQRMSWHLADRILTRMRVNSPNPQVNVLILGDCNLRHSI